MTRRERGSATVFAVSCLALLLIVAAALGVVASLVRAHHAAEAAADLAALSAAVAMQQGGDPCSVAARIAGDNGAALATCRVSGDEVWTWVTVAGPRWLGQSADLTARARAGPAGTGGA